MLENRKFKSKKQDLSEKGREIIALFFALAFFFITYIFIFPTKSGIFGRAFSNVILSMFGTSKKLPQILFDLY
ncbi:MAG: hypothetical protein Nk1A_3540 [Endomicrobiia bacterium]|nr:MAG: hypothetical protein Nk1A_3540 [Endomicrobiia bacterium]